jgi:hypothetical protein
MYDCLCLSHQDNFENCIYIEIAGSSSTNSDTQSDARIYSRCMTSLWRRITGPCKAVDAICVVYSKQMTSERPGHRCGGSQALFVLRPTPWRRIKFILLTSKLQIELNGRLDALLLRESPRSVCSKNTYMVQLKPAFCYHHWRCRPLRASVLLSADVSCTSSWHRY